MKTIITLLDDDTITANSVVYTVVRNNNIDKRNENVHHRVFLN